MNLRLLELTCNAILCAVFSRMFGRMNNVIMNVCGWGGQVLYTVLCMSSPRQASPPTHKSGEEISYGRRLHHHSASRPPWPPLC